MHYLINTKLNLKESNITIIKYLLEKIKIIKYFKKNNF
jgi:hypothetical protein